MRSDPARSCLRCRKAAGSYRHPRTPAIHETPSRIRSRLRGGPSPTVEGGPTSRWPRSEGDAIRVADHQELAATTAGRRAPFRRPSPSRRGRGLRARRPPERLRASCCPRRTRTWPPRSAGPPSRAAPSPPRVSGTRCSAAPRSGDGIVADMGRLRTVHTSRARPAWSSTRGRRCGRCSRPRCRGASPRPVVPDYLDLSVGGILVVGRRRQRDLALRCARPTTSWSCRWSPAAGAGSPARRRATRACSTRCGRGWGRWRSSPGRRSGSSRHPSGCAGSCSTTPTWRRCWATQRLLASERRFEAVQGAVLPAPTGGWMFRLDLVKDLFGEPAGRGRAARGPVRRPVEGRAEHPALPRLPGPAGSAGAAAAIRTAGGRSRIRG